MKVQLIHPPLYLNVHAMTALRPSLPLGLAYVAAALRKAGHDVLVLDAVAAAPEQVTRGSKKQLFALGLTPDQIVARLDPTADVYGVTNMWTFSWPLVRELIRQIKGAHPNTPIVCGGEHFTGLAELSMEQAPVDYIVLGEGEEGAVEVVNAIRIGAEHVDWSAIDGILYRDAHGSPVRSSRPRARNQDIDGIAWPAWDLFDIDVYNEHEFINGLNQGKTVPILATRGCPYQCTYCASPNMWTTRWYPRDPVDVVDEIEQYQRALGATNFPFQDLTAILKRDWVVDFCKEVEQRDLRITWQLPAGTRSEIIDEEVASLLVRSGCRSLNFAPESGSERTRKHMKKMLTDEKLFRAVRASVKAGLNVGAFFVLAYPTDEKEDMQATVKLAARLGRAGIDDVSAGFFFPLPSTEITRQLEQEGKVTYDDAFLKLPIYVHNKFLSEDRKYNDHFTARQLTRWKYKTVAAFYLNSFLFHPGRVFRILWNFVRGKETSKMESFLQETMRKFRLRKKPRGKAGAAKPSQPVAGGVAQGRPSSSASARSS